MISNKLRRFLYRGWAYADWLEEQNPEEPEPHYMTTQDWLNFASKFIDEVNGSKVNPESGLSRKEFLEYMKDGSLPNKQFEEDEDW